MQCSPYSGPCGTARHGTHAYRCTAQALTFCRLANESARSASSWSARANSASRFRALCLSSAVFSARLGLGLGVLPAAKRTILCLRWPVPGALVGGSGAF
jgi:hypothetical protein